jgi:putative Holliday junction resolvase
MKVLALDYGSARTGVAVSDPTGTLARPLCVVTKAASEKGLAYLAGLVAEHEPDVVVVGLPLTLRGERGPQAQESERFAAALRALVTTPVETYDERFTTALAGRDPGTASGGPKAKSRPGEDARAAAHLLESYLQWAAGRS